MARNELSKIQASQQEIVTDSEYDMTITSIIEQCNIEREMNFNNLEPSQEPYRRLDIPTTSEEGDEE